MASSSPSSPSSEINTTILQSDRRERNIFELNAFTTDYPKYPHLSWNLFCTYRDLLLQEALSIEDIVDYGNEYCITAIVKKTGTVRAYKVLDINDELMVEYLLPFVRENEDAGREVCICIVSSDAIVYQILSTSL